MEHLKFHMELITNSLRSCVRIDLRTSAKIQQHQLLGPAIALNFLEITKWYQYDLSVIPTQ